MAVPINNMRVASQQKRRVTMSISISSTKHSVLSTPILIALVTLKGYQEFQKGKHIYIEDLAEYLVDLKSRGVDVSRIALSRSLDKYWSDDVAQFVSEGLVFGFLTHKSPLKFDKRCLEVCKKAIDSRVANNEGLQKIVEQAAQILQLEPNEVLAA